MTNLLPGPPSRRVAKYPSRQPPTIRIVPSARISCVDETGPGSLGSPGDEQFASTINSNRPEVLQASLVRAGPQQMQDKGELLRSMGETTPFFLLQSAAQRPLKRAAKPDEFDADNDVCRDSFIALAQYIWRAVSFRRCCFLVSARKPRLWKWKTYD